MPRPKSVSALSSTLGCDWIRKLEGRLLRPWSVQNDDLSDPLNNPCTRLTLDSLPHRITFCPVFAGHLDFDQLMDFQLHIDLGYDLFGQPAIANLHHRVKVMG